MRASLIAMALLCTTLFAGMARADETTGALTLRMADNSRCDSSDCDIRRQLNLSVSHRFAITSTQASRFTSGTVVQVNLDFTTLTLPLSRDPGFRDGDTTAVVYSQETVMGQPMIFASQITWSQGMFNLVIRGRGTLTLDDVPREEMLPQPPDMRATRVRIEVNPATGTSFGSVARYAVGIRDVLLDLAMASGVDVERSTTTYYSAFELPD